VGLFPRGDGSLSFLSVVLLRADHASRTDALQPGPQTAF
jgi:hypothetical protein